MPVDAERNGRVLVLRLGNAPSHLIDRRLVDELTIIVAPVILGGGKRLFDGFSSSLDLEHLGVRQSQYATFIDYLVKRP